MTITVIDAREAHIIGRAWERYGVELAPEQIVEIETQCRTGRAPLLSRIRSGSERRLVMVNGRALIAVWRPDRQIVITILPRRLDGIALRLISLGVPA